MEGSGGGVPQPLAPLSVGAATCSVKWRQGPAWDGGSPQGCGDEPPRGSPPFSQPELLPQQQSPIPAVAALRNCPALTELRLLLPPSAQNRQLRPCQRGMGALPPRWWFVSSVSLGYVSQHCTKTALLGKENPLRGCLFNSRHSFAEGPGKKSGNWTFLGLILPRSPPL